MRPQGQSRTMSFQGHPWAGDPISKFFFPLPSRPRPARTVPVLGLSFSTRLLVPVVGFGIRWQLPPYRIASMDMAVSSVQSRSKVRFGCLGQRSV